MFFSTWQRFLKPLSPKARKRGRKDRRSSPPNSSRRLLLERLEDRLAPAVSFTPAAGSPHALPPGAGSTYIAVADFNRDGIPDMAVTDFSTSQVSVFFGTGGGAFGAPLNLSTQSAGFGSNPVGIAVGDIDGDIATDGPDIVTANNDGTITTLLSNGNGTFAAPIITRNTSFGLPASAQFAGIAVGDFNNDGVQDVVVTSPNINTVAFGFGDNSGSFGTGHGGFHSFYNFGTKPELVTAANFSGLGTGAAVANQGSGDVSVFPNQTGLITPTNYPAGSNAFGIAAGHFNNDGHPDLAVTNFNAVGTVNVLLNNGNGTFAAATSYSVDSMPVGIATADFNLDGNVDIVTANEGANNSINLLLGKGNGTFQAAQAISPGVGASGPQGIVAADVNNDGLPDLVTNNITSNNVSVLLNTTTLSGNVVINGTTGDTLVINATNSNSGTYSFNGGPPVAFSGVTKFTFNEPGGSGTMTVHNPNGGLFTPEFGVFFNGGGHSSLQVLGGAADATIYNFDPDTAAGHNGTIDLRTGGTTRRVYTYTGLSPINSTITPANVVLNLPNDGTDHKAILEAAGPGMDDIRSQNGTFETTTFANPTTSLTVNVRNTTAVGESLTLAALDPAFAAPNIIYNGGPGGDFFTVKATPSSTTTTFNTGADGEATPDTAFIGGTASSGPQKLDNIKGVVSINGQSGKVALIVDDSASTTSNVYTVFAGTFIQRAGPLPSANIIYGNVQTITLDGGSGGNTIDVNGGASGTSYTINAGSGNDAITLRSTGSAAGLTVNGQAGADTLTVNFAPGNPSPASGINYHGGGQKGDTLRLVGVNANTVTNTFLPDSGGTPHRGTINLDGSVVNYDGLQPVTMVGAITNLVFNVPQGDGDNQTILSDDGGPGDPDGVNDPGRSAIHSGNNTFEYTEFSNPTISLTVNTGNDGETVTFARMDAAYNPTSGTTITGGTAMDTLRVDFSSGVNVIPTGGVKFNGGADNGDGILFVPGYTATNVTHNYADNHSGSIVVDSRTVTYSGLSQTGGIFDPLAASTRVFNFSSAISNNITLGDDPTANNGISRISSTASNPTTDFRNPSTLLTVNLGNVGDTITAGPLDATSPRRPRSTCSAAPAATRSTSPPAPPRPSTSMATSRTRRRPRATG